MSGPSVNRENVSTAPIESLQDPLQQLLSSFASGGGPDLGQFSAGGSNALQSQLGNVFQNLLAQPSAQQRTLDTFSGTLQGIGQGAAGNQLISSARDSLNTNLETGAAVLRQSGPRFGSNTERLIGEQGEQALRDFSVFEGGVRQQDIQNQLAAIDLRGRLSGGADAFRSGVAGQAGQFALGQQGAEQAGLNTQAQLFQQLLQQLFQAGGGGSAPVISQNPGSLSGILGAAGGIGGAALGGPVGSAIGQRILGGSGGKG